MDEALLREVDHPSSYLLGEFEETAFEFSLGNFR